MISTYVLLIDKKIFDKIKKIFKNKIYTSEYILFYDRDCGFCHFTCRVIKRLDVFNLITFADANFKGEKPENFNELSTITAILYNPKTKKQWIRHESFGKILSLIPLGFLLSWIFFIPYIGSIFGKIYDKIANNRTKVSQFFGLPSCDLKNHSNYIYKEFENDSILNKIFRKLKV